MKVSVGEYLLIRLQEMGVRHMFGVPGDFNLTFLEQMLRGGAIEFVGCCNELNAAYAADGYARIAGLSALTTTYGVGELAALAGVAGAYAERVPIVCITGAPPLASMRQGALLHHTMADGNYDNMWNCLSEFTVTQARLVAAKACFEIDRVLRVCWAHKRPVYLQLPSDVVSVEVEPPQDRLVLTSPPSDSRELARAVAAVCARMSQANSPALLIDADVDRFGLMERIVRLAEAHAIPIAHLIPGKGMLNEAHPLAIGVYNGVSSLPHVRETIEDSDCLICVGTRFTDLSTGLFSHKIDVNFIVEVQAFKTKVDNETFRRVTAADLFDGLLERFEQTPFKSFHHPSSPIPKKGPAKTHTEFHNLLTPLTQAVVWSHIQKFIRPGDVLVSDVGTAFFGSINLALPVGTTYIGQPVWGSLGYSLPALLGTCLAARERRQLLFLGDGAFQMTAQELSTILRHDLKPVIFFINNNGYTIERLITGAHSTYNDVAPWGYQHILAGMDYGMRAAFHSVRDEAGLIATLNAANVENKLHFIEMILERMDAPDSLVEFAAKVARFNSQTRELPVVKA